MSRYCAKCDSVILGDAEHDCLTPLDKAQTEMDNAVKTYRLVGIEKALAPSVYEKEIWNAAIEAAAKEAQGAAYDVSNEIRKLKK